jgi:hypothetical protein
MAACQCLLVGAFPFLQLPQYFAEVRHSEYPFFVLAGFLFLQPVGSRPQVHRSFVCILEG